LNFVSDQININIEYLFSSITFLLKIPNNQQ
jgi:hypothetical protein